jgi:ATP-dependent exoDNAse (exonuclease V) alpha subunit
MADTVARFLKDTAMQEAARGGVIIVDEASQLGTRDMLKIFEVAESVKARVLLVGDRRQHRSVTAGEPLRLLETQAGMPVVEVTEILRQGGDYKKAAKLLSEGRIGEAFEQLDKLGWIREVPDADRYQQLADCYLAAVSEKKRNGEQKTALVVSPTHAELDRIQDAVRAGLKAKGKLGKERIVSAWVSAHLTDAQKKDVTQYEPGDLLQFFQNAKGYKKGSRLVVDQEADVPTAQAERFEVYRPTQLALSAGDRIRVTAGGTTKDDKHRLNTGTLLTVQGFNRRGDLIVDHGWVIDKDWGHFTHGYAVTSHVSEGATVDRVFVGISSQSLPATNERTAYVALTRGREKVVVFTDDRIELLKAASRQDDPMSATDLNDSAEGDARLRNGQTMEQELARRLRALRQQQHLHDHDPGRGRGR